MRRTLLVLCWHNVEPTWAFPGTSRSLARFDRQLRLLQRWTNVVPLGTALSDLSAGRRLPPRAVALTFDDGYLDNAGVATERLASHGLAATFFLVPDLLSATVRAWWEDLGWAFATRTKDHVRWADLDISLASPDALAAARVAVEDRLKVTDATTRRAAVDEIVAMLTDGREPPPVETLFMDWHHAHQLAAAGFDIGSHTCSHPILSRETGSEQEREIRVSKQALESELERPVDLLAYPNGRTIDFDVKTTALARAAGYRHALTTVPGQAAGADPPYEVRRHVIGPEDDVSGILLDVARAARRRPRQDA